MIVSNFCFPAYDSITRCAVINTCIKIRDYFSSHDSVLVSVSGGSDSDCIVHLICKYFPEYIPKCHFVFVDTGLEYSATRSHIDYLMDKYNISIVKIRGRSVVSVVREYGVPILNKSRSEDIYYYLRGSQWAIDRIDGGIKSGTRYAYSPAMVNLIHFCRDNGVSVSPRCCNKSKKEPIKRYIKDNNIDLNVTGERKCEGGQRSASHQSCFECHKDGLHKFMPLWWWSDFVKSDFKIKEGIRFSDCYEVYGMSRTGCCGCPFNLNISDDLLRMREFEPQLFNACINVFGISYFLTDYFHCRRKKCIPESLQGLFTGFETLISGGA